MAEDAGVVVISANKEVVSSTNSTWLVVSMEAPDVVYVDALAVVCSAEDAGVVV